MAADRFTLAALYERRFSERVVIILRQDYG
jgi:hypothetical protein